MDLLREAEWTYTMLRQFPAALKLDDRALDITPNDPDVMASKASIYQAQGNLPEAARLLAAINEQTPFVDSFLVKICEFLLERSCAVSLRVLKDRLIKFTCA